MDDEESADHNDGWQRLKPDVVLFETTLGSLDKPIPHPILDDPTKMRRIIANPLYDKLTVSRAAYIQQHQSPESARQSPLLSRSPSRAMMSPMKSLDIDQTLTTPLPYPSETNNSRSQSRSASKRSFPSTLRLPTPASASHRSSSRNTPLPVRSRAKTARPTAQSVRLALAESTAHTKKPVADGTIRYVNSRHGFEVQRYASQNWLTTDIFTKDACQSHEKTFREMLDKKRQYERLSRSIYSSEYYSKRWHELLQSYRQGFLTHAEWAQQNYQLLCLRTLYTQATKREQRDIDLDARDVRQTRAKSAFNEWKEGKHEQKEEEQRSRLNTAHSQRANEGISFLSNNSFSIPTSNITDENNTILIDASRRISTSTIDDNELQPTSVYQPIIASKNPSATSKALYMLDEQRWSLRAMLKRVVGLAEPLPPSPKIIDRKQSPVTTTSADSGFESSP